MDNEFLLLILAALPVILLGMYIYKKDKNKEPTHLLAKLFIGGILSCFLVLIISELLEFLIPLFTKDIETLNLIEIFLYVFIKIAFVEELCKWLISYKLSYNNSHFEEIYDIIVYSVFVSLGFAFFENILYVLQGGIVTGITRALLAVPGHACDGVFMGYYLGLAKQASFKNDKKSEKKYIILSILIPTIMHGIYDYCLFTSKLIFILIFFIYVIFSYIFTVKKIKKISINNTRIKYNDNFCPICGQKVESEYCPMCGNKNN